MMKKLWPVVMLALSALSFNAAMAHGGAQGRHGGAVTTANNPGFEPVGTPTGAVGDIEDHGKPMTAFTVK